MFSDLFKPVFLREPYYFIIPNLCVVVGASVIYYSACSPVTKWVAAGIVAYGVVIIALRTINAVSNIFT